MRTLAKIQTADPLDQLGLIERTGHAGNFTALVKGDQRRDATDAKAAGQLGRFFRIQLRQTKVGFELHGCGLELRCHHFAGPAPGGPEIHHDRRFILVQKFLKTLLVEIHGVPREQGALALAAVGMLGQTRGRHPIGG